MISKRQFCLRNNLEIQAFEVFVKAGLIECLTVRVGKVNRCKIDENQFQNLIQGHHYVECPMCLRKMITLDVHFIRLHPGEIYSGPLYGTWHEGRMAKTEIQKKAQSKKLLERFQTPEGEVTREQIRRSMVLVSNTPEIKAAKSRAMKANWAEPAQREKYEKAYLKAWQNDERRQHMSHQARTNPKMIQALEAGRKINPKTSKPHLTLKKAMEEAGLLEFQTEYEIGPYMVDEARPDLRLVVEMDGCYWHGCEKCGFEPYGDNARRDRSKNTYLKRRGWYVLRIPGHDVVNNLAGAVARVAQAIEHVS